MVIMHSRAPLAALLHVYCKHYCQVLLCALVAVLLVLLALVPANTGTPVQKMLTSPMQGGAWVRSPTAAPRVVFVVAQTGYSPGWCRMMLSAIVSRVSVVSIGFGGNYSHTVRISWLLNYMEEAGLRDEDVVVMFDGGDTFFTRPLWAKEAVKDFLAKTAPSADAFNATAVHRGEASAPMLFSTEPKCWAPQVDLVVPSGPEEQYERCRWFYERLWKVANSSADQRLVQSPPSGFRYLTAGLMVGRVWAIREAFKAYASLLAKSDKWWCDQTIWALLFVWSVTQDPVVDPALRTRYGLLSLDYNNSFLLIPRYTPFGSPAIIHFAGPIYIWWRLLPIYLNYTDWFQPLRQSPTFAQEARDLLQTTTVAVFDVKGRESATRFSDVCSLKDVLDPQWLSRTLEKVPGM
ncbi:expression site-associated gene (ESAG-like) protein [Trypanosoma conorhini]|uniref:Expression site-associated gene (ESAG-like) protein n=1 Tax=Trypanosoma conorhini TaxID=83891 RepID=A0A3R7LFA2_9TRYP|nr:expression site-associated gene (ESAG-like) protein [Trypanosoma conorhini]RNE96122.1 expression site-associated gene (ESAG-like) protein [Trypanosoma conorhini]